MKFSRPNRSRRGFRRSSYRGPRAGFGAVIGREIVLLRMLHAVPSDDDIVDQREVVAGVLSALRSCLQQLPIPERFKGLETSAPRAGVAQDLAIASSTKETIRQANADLARKLSDAHAPLLCRQEWEATLTHAAAAHHEMASAVRWKHSPK